MSKTFDALTTARHLKEAGMEEPHAEAIADAVRDSREGLATEAALEAGLDALNSRLHIITWMIGLLFVMNMTTIGVMLARSF